MRYEQTKHISDVIRDVIKEAHLEEGLSRCHVFDAWEEVVKDVTRGVYPPENASSLTLEKRLKDGVLSVKMNSSMLRMQFRMNASALLSKLNARLATEDKVKSISFR